MATVYGIEWTSAFINDVVDKIEADKWNGRVRMLYASYTLDGELTDGDFVKLFKLPKGARIVDARFVAPSDGTSGQYAFGWAAGADGDEAADNDGLFAGATLDTGAGAVDEKLAGTSAGFMKRFSEQVDMQLEVIETTTASDGDTLEAIVFYVND